MMFLYSVLAIIALIDTEIIRYKMPPEIHVLMRNKVTTAFLAGTFGIPFIAIFFVGLLGLGNASGISEGVLPLFLFGGIYMRWWTWYELQSEAEKIGAKNSLDEKIAGGGQASYSAPEHDDFAYAGNQDHEQHFHNTQAQSGGYGFDSSKFKNPNWTEKDAEMYEYCNMRRDDPSSSPPERMKCQKIMISLENKGKDNLKQLPAPS